MWLSIRVGIMVLNLNHVSNRGPWYRRTAPPLFQELAWLCWKQNHNLDHLCFIIDRNIRCQVEWILGSKHQTFHSTKLISAYLKMTILLRPRSCRRWTGKSCSSTRSANSGYSICEVLPIVRMDRLIYVYMLRSPDNMSQNKIQHFLGTVSFQF